MNLYRQTSDGRGIYREGAAAEVARIDSTPQLGNLADVTKNSTVILPRTLVETTRLVAKTYTIDDIVEANAE